MRRAPGSRRPNRSGGRGLGLERIQALIARAAVYIGGDSGPLHVASTTRTPVVALLGPTLPERSRPWRDRGCPRRSWTRTAALPRVTSASLRTWHFRA